MYNHADIKNNSSDKLFVLAGKYFGLHNKDMANTIVTMRKFLLGAYHDLPNVLFVSSFVLGSLIGYLPLIWVSIGLIANAGIIALLQNFLAFLFPTWNQVMRPSYNIMCEIFGRVRTPMPPNRDAVTIIAPSQWLGAASFFATFVSYNSIALLMRPAATGASSEKVDNRRAFSITTLLISIIFLLFVFARGFTGCESWLGGILGVGVGGGVAILYWYLLDACGTGAIPDVLQITNAMAPEGSNDEPTPIICT